MNTENKKETILKKLQRSNPGVNVRDAIRRSQAASDRSEGLKGTLGAYRIAEMVVRTPSK